MWKEEVFVISLKNFSIAPEIDYILRVGGVWKTRGKPSHLETKGYFSIFLYLEAKIPSSLWKTLCMCRTSCVGAIHRGCG
jgi:hypothetical protein